MTSTRLIFKIKPLTVFCLGLMVFAAIGCGPRDTIVASTEQASTMTILRQTTASETLIQEMMEVDDIFGYLVVEGTSLLGGQMPGFRLGIPLLDGSVVRFTRTALSVADEFGQSWFGRSPSGDAVLRIEKDLVIGSLQVGTVTYRVRSTARGEVVVSQLLPNNRDCGVSDKGYSASPTTVHPTMKHIGVYDELGFDPRTVVSVLFLYTREARNRAAHPSAPHDPTFIEARIRRDLDVTNDILAKSRIDHRVVVAHMTSTSYLEAATLVEDRDWAAEQLGNASSDLTGLRNEHSADIISLWVNSTDPDFCGFAAQYDYNRSSSIDKAVHVVDQGCGATHVLAHELGHNFGAHHDEVTEPARISLSYARGATLHSLRQYTLMAYPGPCEDRRAADGGIGVECSRLLYFSNPDIIVSGVKIGCEAGADNARVLNRYMPKVAKYR
jgi:hypothetical protein